MLIIYALIALLTAHSTVWATAAEEPLDIVRRLYTKSVVHYDKHYQR